MSEQLPQLVIVANKLRRAGARLPAPEVTGEPEGAVKAGLSIALAIVEDALQQAVSHAVGAWQPLDSAPLDTRVLVLFDDSSGHIEDAVFYRDDDGGDLRYTLFDGDMLMASKPRAWMPYPAGPQS